MAKFILEGDTNDYREMVQREAELMIARALLSGNAHQPLNVATMLTAHQQVTQLPYQQPTYQQLPAPPQPPALPAAPLPAAPLPSTYPAQYPATVIQDGAVIQTQATVIPPSPPRTIAIPVKAPRLTKRQQRAIAIIAGVAVSLWVMDAIIPGLPGRVLSGVQNLYQDAPTMPTTEAPATEPEASSTTETTPAPSDSAQEQTFNAPPDVVERIREAGRKPAAPTQ